MGEITTELIRRTLAAELGDNDSGEKTVRGYLLRLLHDVWSRQDGFSGKRPFGRSGWDADVYAPLVRAGILPGRLDEDGYLDEIDDDRAQELILACIASLDAP